MPVTSVGSKPVGRAPAPAPAPTPAPAPAAATPPPTPTPTPEPAPAPTPAAKPAADAVGHGVTRLKPRPGPQALDQPFVPGTPPPKRETAGAHGAHRGRISIR